MQSHSVNKDRSKLHAPQSCTTCEHSTVIWSTGLSSGHYNNSLSFDEKKVACYNHPLLFHSNLDIQTQVHTRGVVETNKNLYKHFKQKHLYVAAIHNKNAEDCTYSSHKSQTIQRRNLVRDTKGT